MKIVYFIFLFSSGAHLFAQDEIINHSGRKTLYELEVAFSDAAKKIGFIAANSSYAAVDAIVFRPREINAREWSRQNSIKEYARKNNISNIAEWMKKNNVKDTTLWVQWVPSFVDVSLGGDLGYATGPFENRSVTPVGRGQFVTVWLKQEDGTFKYIMDFGSNLLPPSFNFVEEPAFEPVASDAKVQYVKVDKEKESSDIMKLEQTFSQLCQSSGDMKAYKKFARNDIRFIYQSQFQVIGIDSLERRINKQKGSHIWSPKQAVVAVSGDLAHVYGTHQFKDGDIIKDGYYMRIWKRLPGKPWMIAVQVRSIL